MVSYVVCVPRPDSLVCILTTSPLKLRRTDGIGSLTCCSFNFGELTACLVWCTSYTISFTKVNIIMSHPGHDERPRC